MTRRGNPMHGGGASSRRELLAWSAGVSLTLGGRAQGAWHVLAKSQERSAANARAESFGELAFGMVVHYGLYSLYESGDLVKERLGLSTVAYMKFLERFRARSFSGRDLARAARRAGMGYATLVTRHYDGFSLFDTRGLSPYDVTKTPAARDLVADFIGGCRAEGIQPLLLTSVLDWSDERFARDFKGYLQYVRSSVELLCTQYGPLCGLVLDGFWSRPDADWELDELLGLIRRAQPDALVLEVRADAASGGPRHVDLDGLCAAPAVPDGEIGPPPAPAWAERGVSMQATRAWSARDYGEPSPARFIEALCRARAAGANLGVDVGPTADGSLHDYPRAALARVGDWIEQHGGRRGPLVRGRPSIVRARGRDAALELEGELYLLVFDPAPGPRTFEGLTFAARRATWMDCGDEVRFDQQADRLTLNVVDAPYGTHSVVRLVRVEP